MSCMLDLTVRHKNVSH